MDDAEARAARQLKDWIVDGGDFDQLDLVGVGGLDGENFVMALVMVSIWMMDVPSRT